MEVIAILAGVAFAVNKTVSVIKSLVSGRGKSRWNTPVTQLLVWVVAVGAVVLLNHASITEATPVPGLVDTTFGSIDGASIVLLGWILGSTGSFAWDFTKVLDSTGSAAEPRLIDDAPVG